MSKALNFEQQLDTAALFTQGQNILNLLKKAQEDGHLPSIEIVERGKTAQFWVRDGNKTYSCKVLLEGPYREELFEKMRISIPLELSAGTDAIPAKAEHKIQVGFINGQILFRYSWGPQTKPAVFSPVNFVFPNLESYGLCSAKDEKEDLESGFHQLFVLPNPRGLESLEGLTDLASKAWEAKKTGDQKTVKTFTKKVSPFFSPAFDRPLKVNGKVVSAEKFIEDRVSGFAKACKLMWTPQELPKFSSGIVCASPLDAEGENFMCSPKSVWESPFGTSTAAIIRDDVKEWATIVLDLAESRKGLRAKGRKNRRPAPLTQKLGDIQWA